MATSTQGGFVSAQASDRSGSGIIDALCVGLLVLIPAAAYLPQLGFYSDDWFIVGRFHTAAADGWLKVAELGVTDTFAARPGHGLYAALLYGLFGLEPLGYHLVNTAVLAACFASLYLLMLRLRVSRFDALAICAIAAVLPQFSTVRVWLAAAQIPLSLLFFLLSVHGQLSYLQRRRLGWLFPAVAAALASVACYELFVPLLVASSVAMVAVRVRQGGGLERNAGWKATAPLLLVALAAIAALVLKAAMSERTGSVADPMHYLKIAYRLIRPDYDWRIDNGLNAYAALSVNFWHPVLGWAKAGAAMLRSVAPQAILLGIAASGLVYWRAAPSSKEEEGTQPGLLLVAGLLVFALGLAIFLIVPAIIFSPTGLANRVLVAAGIGAAIVYWGVIRLVGAKLPVRLGQGFAISCLCLVVGLGTARVVQVASHWVEASRLQAQLLSSARADLVSVPAGSTVILDGICSYRGPGVVFETHWDSGPALSLAAGKKLRADVFSERMTITRTGFEATIYGEVASYPFGRSLFAYDPQRPSLVRLTDAATAKAYLVATQRNRSCPKGYVGHGVLL